MESSELSDRGLPVAGLDDPRDSARADAAGRTLSDRLRRRADVLVSLTAADLAARYGAGRGRILKWLLDPFALFGVYLVFLVFVLDRGGPAPALSVACAIVPFHLVLLGAMSNLTAISTGKSLIGHTGFERWMIPVSVTLTEVVGFAASFVLLALTMVVSGVAPTLAALWLVPAVVVTLAVAVAFGYAASLFGVWFPDLAPFARSVIRTLYFVAPGLVTLDQIHGRAHELVKLNPLTGIFESFRDALLYATTPAAWELLYPAAFAVVLVLAVFPLYRREADHFGKLG